MSVYDFTVETKDGTDQKLSDYAGQVLLIVNTASKCGFTPQYDGLQKLHERYGDLGFSVLGFPCNQFGHQEPGSDAEIQEFCRLNYGVTFPVFAKIDVNGETTHPLYDYLKSEAPGMLNSKAIKWNFTKFLVSRNGKVLKRFSPKTSPADIDAELSALLTNKD